MDIKTSDYFRFGRAKKLQYDGNMKYNYAEDGILRRCLPHIFFKSNNLLLTLIQLIDLRLIMLFKYIDRLKNFKDITQY